MDGRDLVSALAADPFTRTTFIGVYSYDRIPEKVPKYPAAYIFNTDPSAEPGEHWVSLYFESPTRADYFDSYGLPPVGEFYKFAKNNTKNIHYSKQWLQSPITRVCGLYALYFIQNRCTGLSLADILTHFEEYNWQKNDKSVQVWFLAWVDVLNEGA